MSCSVSASNKTKGNIAISGQRTVIFNKERNLPRMYILIATQKNQQLIITRYNAVRRSLLWITRQASLNANASAKHWPCKVKTKLKTKRSKHNKRLSSKTTTSCFIIMFEFYRLFWHRERKSFLKQKKGAFFTQRDEKSMLYYKCCVGLGLILICQLPISCFYS